MKWTPDMIAGVYDFLRTTMPFKKWRLPEADDVEFHVIPLRDSTCGDARVDGVSAPRIRICTMRHCTTHSLIESMAHEMIHIHLLKLDGRTEHGPRFKRLAAEVRKHHLINVY